jgi:hypothetical protein
MVGIGLCSFFEAIVIVKFILEGPEFVTKSGVRKENWAFRENLLDLSSGACFDLMKVPA